MPKQLSHEDISQRFIDSGAFNFDAMGKFVAEIGPELAVADDGFHGVIIGRHNMIACFKRFDDLAREVGGLREIAGLNAALDIPVNG